MRSRLVYEIVTEDESSNVDLIDELGSIQRA